MNWHKNEYRHSFQSMHQTDISDPLICFLASPQARVQHGADTDSWFSYQRLITQSCPQRQRTQLIIYSHSNVKWNQNIMSIKCPSAEALTSPVYHTMSSIHLFMRRGRHLVASYVNCCYVYSTCWVPVYQEFAQNEICCLRETSAKNRKICVHGNYITTWFILK